VDPNSYDDRFLNAAVYGEDQWTVRGLTLNYGLRLDTHDSGYPAESEPATAYFGTRSFPGATVIQWRDWDPRLGVAYDLFGNGKTALKANISRYVTWDGVNLAMNVNPAAVTGGSLTRTWTDLNHDFVPQGNPANSQANGELGPSPNGNWGTSLPPSSFASYDPAWSHGWGKRGYNWERSVGVQHELFANVSLAGGFFYRTYGNFPLTVNAAVGPSDFDTFCITAPLNTQLPNGGGNQICGLYDVKPAAVSLVRNVTTLASNYGGITQNYKGLDVSVKLRLSKALLQGGVNSGRELYDLCGVVGAAPAILISGSTKTPADYCHQQQPFLTQVKLLGSYTLPWELDVSATYQNSYNTGSTATNFGFGFSAPRTGLAANYLATNAQIAPSLGRNLSAGATATASINLVTPSTLFWDRIQSIDLRFARTFKVQRVSLRGLLDVYNLTNANTTFLLNQNYGTNGATWLQPLQVLAPRLVKLGVQASF
jgi:hypothetical protein